MPRTAAIQKTAVGGGFIAVGAVTLSAGAVAGVGGAVVGSTIPSEQAEAFNTTLLFAVGIPVVIGVAELVAGGLLLQRGGEEIDAADRLQTKKDAALSDRVREITRPRPKPVRTEPETPMWGPSQTPQAGDESDDTSPR